MKVYVITQEWQSKDGDHDSFLIAAFDSLEKASKKLKELYKEDIEWIKECYEDITTEEDIEEAFCSNTYSNVFHEDCWSTNNLEELEVL